MGGPLVESHQVTPGYFRAMGVQLLQGRVFNADDVRTAVDLDARERELYENDKKPPPEQSNAMVYPTIINEKMAKLFWPKQNAIGQFFSQGRENGPWRQVVGVVNDVRQWGLTRAPQPEAYDVFTGDSYLMLVVHTSMPPSSLAPQVRSILGQLDSSLPLFNTRTMDEVIADHSQGQQFLSVLVGTFAGLAMLLAAVGIYGVLSYVVTQRTREIGIRMSLGASHGNVLVQILREGMALAVIGLAIGVAGALAAGDVMRSLLHEVKPGDPAIFVATAIFLAAVALLACYIPAQRAARLNPMIALRHE
jgi:putative ABC transport system permease protein